MSIVKRGDVWYYDFYCSGKRIRKRGSRDKRTTEQMLRNEQINSDKNNAGIPNDISIGKLIEEYLKHAQATKKESTYTRDCVCLKEFKATINPASKLSHFAHNISRSLDAYKASKLNSGRNPFTLNIFIRTIKAMLNQAVRWKYLTYSPLAGFKLAQVMKNPRPRILANEEIRKILDLCDQELKDIVLTFIYSGLRAAELLFLEWQDIDFEKNIIKVQEKDIWIPKSYERREIPIHPRLKRLLMRRSLIRSNCFVFFKSSGDREIERKRRKPTQGVTYRILYRHFQKILAQAGIEGVRLHTLRHTFGSHCVMAGIDLPTLSKLMGHSVIKTTMIYVHLSIEHMQNSILKLDYDVKEIIDKIIANVSEGQS